MPSSRVVSTWLIAALVAGLGGMTPARAEAPESSASSLAGTWQGEIAVNALKLHVILHLAARPDGTIGGSFDVPEQGAKDLALDEVGLTGGQVRVTCEKIRLVYTGRLAADGQTIAGEWSQAGHGLAVNFQRTAVPLTIKRPQEPQPPFPYVAEDVTYRHPTGHFTIAGTLTLPRQGRPAPAILLITGSGSQDRDETIMGHKPFKLWADALTRRGFAVLRLDDRGVGGTGGDAEHATTADLATDVEAGLAYLRTRQEIDPKRIGLMGHSEGGVIAPMVAAQDPGVAFIVLLAGTGLPGRDVLVAQNAAMLKLLGKTEAEIDQATRTNRQLYEIACGDPPDSAAPRLRKRLSEAGIPPERQDSEIKAITSPWFRYFLSYDPRVALRRVKCPVLAVNGDRDVQVLAGENLPAIAQALREARNPDATTRVLPGLNHLFQTCQRGGMDEYFQIEETLAPAALKVVGDWLAQHAGP